MAHAWKHNPVPPASRAPCLIGIDVVTFWQHCAEAGERHYSTMCFSTEETEKAKGCLCSACIRRIFDFLFFFFFLVTVFQLQNVMWMNIPFYRGLIHCNYVCKWMFAFTTVGYTTIILLWLCHVCLCPCGCNSIYFCLSDFALCGSYKPIWCRVVEIQIDFTSTLSSQLSQTDIPKLLPPVGLKVKEQFSIKGTIIYSIIFFIIHMV